MKSLVSMTILTMAMSLNAVAGGGTVDSDKLNTIQELSTMLGDGRYKGVSDNGEACNVGVSVHNDTYTITISPEGFDFYSSEGRKSSECMYSKACFSITADYSKLLNKARTTSTYDVRVERPGGGPDLASAKKMSLSVKRTEKGLRFGVKEQVGLFNMFSTEANCTL